MSKLVIIEGPDGAGKTTLSRNISQAFGHAYFHEGPPPQDVAPRDYYKTRLFELMLEAFARVPGRAVVDRFALGDRVYGPILRGEDRLGPEGWTEIRGYLDALQATRILALPPYEVCRAAFLEAKQLIKDEDTFRRTYDRWASFKDDPGQVVYDWTEGNEDKVLDRIWVGLKEGGW